MPEKFIEGKIETEPEKEKMPESIITLDFTPNLKKSLIRLKNSLN